MKVSGSLLFLVLLLAIGDFATARTTRDIHPNTQFTPIVTSTLTQPTAVRGTDNRFHIAYELVLTNTTPMSIQFERLEVRDAGSKRVLAVITGPALTAAMNPIGGLSPDQPQSAATTLAPSAAAVAWLDVTVRRRAAIPRVLEHRMVATGTMQSGDGPPAPLRFSGVIGTFRTSSRPPVVLGPPVGGGRWVADEGCCTNPTHHRRGMVGVNGELLVPQRFAIDWFLLDARNRAWVGDPTRLRSYPSYGQRLHAAAAGTVVAARDGIRDNRPQGTLPQLPPMADTVGNHVTLKIGHGRYLLYGHMKRGSVRVRRGQRVRPGQVLGQLGNSGNSSTPHLHFQVITRPTFFPSDSVPFRFDAFRLRGQITEHFSDEDLALRPTGALSFTAARPQRIARMEMPLDRAVVSFPAPRVRPRR